MLSSESVSLNKGIITNLQKKMTTFKNLSNRHMKMGVVYKIFYFSLGSMSVVFSVICTALSGAMSSVDTGNKLAVAIFALSLLASLFSAITGFFGLEEKIVKHRDSKIQYRDMFSDIDLELLERHSNDELMALESILVEKEKFVRAYEPSLSPCLN